MLLNRNILRLVRKLEAAKWPKRILDMEVAAVLAETLNLEGFGWDVDRLVADAMGHLHDRYDIVPEFTASIPDVAFLRQKLAPDWRFRTKYVEPTWEMTMAHPTGVDGKPWFATAKSRIRPCAELAALGLAKIRTRLDQGLSDGAIE